LGILAWMQNWSPRWFLEHAAKSGRPGSSGFDRFTGPNISPRARFRTIRRMTFANFDKPAEGALPAIDPAKAQPLPMAQTIP
jgi:hypothetical protein